MNSAKSNLRTLEPNHELRGLIDDNSGPGSYRIPTRNLNVYTIERVLKALGVRFTLAYGRGMEDPDPESTVTFRLAEIDRGLAECIAQLIEHLNRTAVLIVEDRV